MIFNQQGLLDIDGMIAAAPSFQKIMDDGIVTDEELSQQTDKVINLMREAEQRFSEEDQLFIKRLFAETNVLSAIYQYYELQELK
jgi:hypothetical protein